jgi:hypothetical protein
MGHKWSYQTNRHPARPDAAQPARSDDLRTLGAELVDAAREWLWEAEAFYGRDDADESWLRRRYAELRGETA